MRDMIEPSVVGPVGTNVTPAQTATGVQLDARHGQSDAVLWRHFGFDHGGSCYGFETTRTGDRSRVVINGKAALELPQAVWAALLKAAFLQSGPAAQFGAEPFDGAWDQTEDDQLRRAWSGGMNIQELAVLHQRSRGAIVARLERLGLAESRSPMQPPPSIASASH